MNEWQPIETAPKDGTEILTVNIHGDIQITEWYSVTRDDYVHIEGEIYRKEITLWHEGWNGNNPTHWMPLPAPPKASP